MQRDFNRTSCPKKDETQIAAATCSREPKRTLRIRIIASRNQQRHRIPLNQRFKIIYCDHPNKDETDVAAAPRLEETAPKGRLKKKFTPKRPKKPDAAHYYLNKCRSRLKCRICDTEFAHLYQFLYHYKATFPCISSSCKRQFKSITRILRHLKDCHANNPRFNCVDCNENRFDDEFTLVLRIVGRLSSKAFQCSICQSKLSGKTCANGHENDLGALLGTNRIKRSKDPDRQGLFMCRLCEHYPSLPSCLRHFEPAKRRGRYNTKYNKFLKKFNRFHNRHEPRHKTRKNRDIDILGDVLLDEVLIQSKFTLKCCTKYRVWNKNKFVKKYREVHRHHAPRQSHLNNIQYTKILNDVSIEKVVTKSLYIWKCCCRKYQVWYNNGLLKKFRKLQQHEPKKRIHKKFLRDPMFKKFSTKLRNLKTWRERCEGYIILYNLLVNKYEQKQRPCTNLLKDNLFGGITKGKLLFEKYDTFFHDIPVKKPKQTPHRRMPKDLLFGKVSTQSKLSLKQYCKKQEVLYNNMFAKKFETLHSRKSSEIEIFEDQLFAGVSTENMLSFQDPDITNIPLKGYQLNFQEQMILKAVGVQHFQINMSLVFQNTWIISSNKKLLCFPCFLFYEPGDSNEAWQWSRRGIEAVGSFREKISEHQEMASHIVSCYNYNTLGDPGPEVSEIVDTVYEWRPIYYSKTYKKGLPYFQEQVTSKNLVKILKKGFSNLTFQQQADILKIGRPNPSVNDWMCSCGIYNTLYCFPCLLYLDTSSDPVWTRYGVKPAPNLAKKIRNHEGFGSHDRACQRYRLERRKTGKTTTL